MNKENQISFNNRDELKTLEGKYLYAREQLRHAGNQKQRRKLEEHVEDIKMDLAWALLDCGENEKGLTLYSSVCGRKHREAKYNGMGRALIEMKHYGEARKILEKGLKEFPESCALWTCLGNLNEALGDHFESWICFEAAIRCDSEERSGLVYNKALALIHLGSHAEAVAILDCLIEQYPEEPVYLAERGNCALDTGYPYEALQYYQKAMALLSESRDSDPHAGVCIYAGVCSAYIELGMKREAIVAALEGLKRFPDQDSVLYYNAGAASLGMGWRNEGLEILKKGVEKFPDDEELKDFLKQVEDDMDDPDRGDNLPFLGVILLMAMIHKKWRKK